MFYSDVAREGDTKEENSRHEAHNANRRRGVTSEHSGFYYAC